MVYGMCDNCYNRLTDDSAILTEESKIFMGSNCYAVCKNCNQVLLYNKKRKEVFSLDKYKDDQAVIDEINELLERMDDRYTVAPIEEKDNYCEGNCDVCQGCSEDEHVEEILNKLSSRMEEVKAKKALQQQQQQIEESKQDNSILAINKKDSNQVCLIKESELNMIEVTDLPNWNFYELNPITIKAIVTYEISKH